MSKIELTDTTRDVVVKMSEGNPGALRVTMELLSKTKDIDPDNALGGLGTILRMDDMGIYGPRIWMLYKDVCGEDLTKMVGLLRAQQLGIVSKSKLYHAIENWGDGLKLNVIMSQVRERLPRFAGNEEVQSTSN